MQSNIYQQQGRDHYKRGEYQKALECFDRAIGRAVSVQLLDNRAACNARLNDFPAALKDAKKAINLAREDPTGYLRAAKVLLSMDRKSVALEIYAHALKSVKHVGQGYEALRKAHGELLSELAPAKSIDPFTVLPREIAINILEHLDFRDRTAIMRTSKQWRSFIRSDPNLWTHLDFSKARRKRVRTSFVTTAINTAGRRIRQATITAKNYDVEKVLAALARQTSLEKLVLPDIGRFDQTSVEALKYARHLNHIVIGYETEITSHAWKSFLDQFLPQLRHVDLDLTKCRAPGQRGPFVPALDTSGLLTYHLKAWKAELSELMPSLAPATSLQSLSMCINDSLVNFDHEMDFRPFSDLRYLCLHFRGPKIERIRFPPSIEILKLGGTLRDLGYDWVEDLLLPYRYGLPNLIELELDQLIRLGGGSFAALDQRQTESNNIGCVVMPLRRLTLHSPIQLLTSHLRTGPTSRAHVAVDSNMRDNSRLNALEHLALLGAGEIQEVYLVELINHAPNLRSLDLGRTRLTGVAIKKVVEMRRLKELRIGPSESYPRDAIDWARAQDVRVHVTPHVEPKPQSSPYPRRPNFPF
jgi:tetratricopeptide (TPR) repeat protein